MIIAIVSGSTRTGRLSHNVSLVLAAKLQHLTGQVPVMIDLAAYHIPVFEERLDKQSIPSADLQKVSDLLQSADAIIFVSPEYNGTYTPALKNMVDSLGKKEFARKVIGCVSVSTGALGGLRGALSMQQLVLAIGGIALPQMLLVPVVQDKVNHNAEFTDTTFETKATDFLKEFLWLASAVHAKKLLGQTH
ncbi:NAD(P)H-dependent FMN reductase [Chitinophaga costaii]|uniref:NAD(P)H-dependent FMN reductase n=1 Tax=Chitinophaga costaii TaxID=1335309 RepID=A0A1C4G138_9BACT|nr:NAD(P)H-dependent oxidoreductase [Chitinophaga costaii]PUZ19946.1 NADPH-dependent oxidoreductase [Chitinophaga costaii]SCC61834.1 NAD(P)H-dependent FMN reductase [Chitinophaga costaii]